MAISRNIKLLRERYGLSQKDLAEIAGVTDKAVSTWELGIKEPRMGAIQKIADHFGLLKSNIIEEDGLGIVSNKTPREVFARNLKKWLSSRGKTQMDLVNDLNLTSSIVSDWVNGKKFPRIDKVQMLSDYLGILKSDLIEDKKDNHNESSKITLFTQGKIIEYDDLPEESQRELESYVQYLRSKQKQGKEV